ncbi:MAG TPA: SRPBCC family protein [Terriglobales bacterium]|jgi:ligand-binding SRPBCC domain-containing protein
MRHPFATEAWFPYPIESVFAFFSDPENLPRIMPAWQKAVIESAKLMRPPDMEGTPCEVAGKGSELLITFRMLPFMPLRKSWRALISEFEYLSHFCDVQMSGPFKYWHHCHHFRSEQRGDVMGTIVRDELEYELPLTWLADAGDTVVRTNIAGVFRYRQKETERLLPEWLRAHGVQL